VDRTLATLPLSAIEAFVIAEGAHADRSNGLCSMELVAWLAGAPHSDHPPCVSPVLGAFVRRLNDDWGADDRQRLKPILPLLIGTADDGLDEERGWMIADWLVRIYTPAWLELAGIGESATALRALPPLTRDNALAAHPTIETARVRGAAAGDAAWAAARAAAWDAAWDAAGDAAWDAAWAATRAAAGDAARAAAWDAAGAAAWAAARDAARDAAWAAARDAAWDSARDVARAAARDVARDVAWAAARDAARDAAWETISDKIKKQNPFETLIDIWLLGYVVYFDKNTLIAGYVPK
jgi:hypothetical protein